MKKLLPVLAIPALLTACNQPYTVTLNDNVLYSPRGSAQQDRLLEDANLQGCLNQAVINRGISDPGAVTLLACPDSGVSSLAGIDRLPRLAQLDLSNNDIGDLAPLNPLKNLQVLNLAGNQLRTVAVLNNLPLLSFLDLSGNREIVCRQLNPLEERLGQSLIKPEHCQ